MSQAELPMWSVVVPAHNCANYLELTLESVLGQLGHRTDAEIVVVDDGSRDNPKEIVDRLGAGRIRYVRNEQALGAVPNFNKCLSEASGRLIHLLHGDDLVLPGFYQEMETAFSNDSVAMAFCRTQHVNGDGVPLSVTRRYVPQGGIWEDALFCLASSNRIATPSVVLRRSIYEAAGTFNETLPHAADWDMWLRGAQVGAVYFIDRVLAHYRVHAQNDSSARIATGANMEERFTALDGILKHMPPEQHPALRRKAAVSAAVYATRQTVRQAKLGNLKNALVQASWVPRSLWRSQRPGS